MRHPTRVLSTPTLLFALLHLASPVFAFKHKPSITSTLELTGLDAATFKLLFVFAVIFILPFLAVLIYTISKLFLGTYTFRRRLSWAIYPIALGSGLFAASCTLKAVVLSQTRRRTLKKAFNSSVAGVMARFTRKLSFTVLCIALLANVSWRLKDILQRHNTGAISGYVHPGQGVRRRSTSVTESTTPSFVWNDVITRFEGLSGIVIVIMLIATAVPSVLNASSSPSDAEVDISDGFEYVWLGFYGLVSLAYVGVHLWMCVEGHGTYKAYEGYKIGLFGVSPIILIRWIYEVVYTALIIEAHDNSNINLAELGLADDIVTPLTYLFLLLFVFLVAADGRVDRNASGREGRNTMLRRTARISAEFDKDEY